MRYFIDSNIFIYIVQAHEEFGEQCKILIDKIESNEIDAFTSVLNLAEVCEVVKKYSNRKKAIKAGELISALNIEILPIVKEHLFMGSEFLKRYNISYFDCIYLGLMKERYIENIITNDDHFARVEGIKMIRPSGISKISG